MQVLPRPPQRFGAEHQLRLTVLQAADDARVEGPPLGDQPGVELHEPGAVAASGLRRDLLGQTLELLARVAVAAVRDWPGAVDLVRFVLFSTDLLAAFELALR